MRHVLFICSRNRLRSPTAERVFSKWPGIEVMSAGVNVDAVEPVTPELLEWADLIFLMETVHRTKLMKKFGSYIKNQKLVVLGIADDFRFMEPALVALLEKLVAPHLPSNAVH